MFFVIANSIHRSAWAGEASGSLELAMQESSTSNNSVSHIDTSIHSQRLNMDYADYFYRPWLLDYRIGGTLSETSIDKQVDNTSMDTVTDLTAYRFNGKLFPYSPFPMTMYAMENHTDVSIQSEPDSSIDTRLYGADLKLDFYTLPTTNLFYYGQTTESSLSGILTEQDNNTGGINMFKRWEGLTANLRYENSDYRETHSQKSATADRLSGSLVYRPSDSLQSSFVYTGYDREADKPYSSDFDPLYSDRESLSHNLSMLWSPVAQFNIGLYANYFLEDYESSRREAKDGRATMDWRLSDHLSAFASSYALQTEQDGLDNKSHDARSGLAYNRAWLFGSVELQGRLSGGYFSRRIETGTKTENQQGGFHQAGGRVALNLPVSKMMLSPYYDVNFGYNQQTNIHASRTSQQDVGFTLDGNLGGGRINGSVSYMELGQDSDINIRSEQFRSYLNYEHRVMQRAKVMLTLGKYYTKGHVENNTYESFTSTEDTETRSRYSHIDFVSPIYGTNILCSSSYRHEKRSSQSGQQERVELFDIRLTHQFGKLFTEAGFMKKNTQLGDVNSKDAVWFIKLRRDFSFGHK